MCGPTPRCVAFSQVTSLMHRKVKCILLSITFLFKCSICSYLLIYFHILVITLIYNCSAIVVNLIECGSSIVYEFLSREGPELLHMRIKHLMKHKDMEKAARLAKTCTEFPEFGGKKNFKPIYLVCLCEIKSQEELIQEVRVFKKKSVYFALLLNFKHIYSFISALSHFLFHLKL